MSAHMSRPPADELAPTRGVLFGLLFSLPIWAAVIVLLVVFL